MCKPCIITALIFLAVVTGAFFYLWNEAHAAGEVIINEIAWMGTSVSTADEWIELYNNTSSDIELTGWGIYESGGETLVEPLDGTIGANSYYLIERTDDTTVPNMPASQEPTPWGGNGLINLPSGEHLILKDAGNNIIDEVNALNGWPAGDNSTKSTMERTGTGSWQTGPVGGTPKAQNSSVASESDPEPEPLTETSDKQQETSNNQDTNSNNQTDTEDQIQETPPPSQSEDEGQAEEVPNEPEFTKTNNVIISEVMPNPEGSDSENEWIELYNKGSEIINISGWFIDDMEGGSKPFALPENTTVLPGEYRVFAIKLTKIALNNGGDAVRLLYPDNTVANEITYDGEGNEGESWAIVGGGWMWTDNATPGYKNEGLSPKTIIEKQETNKNTPTTAKPKDTNDDSLDEASYENKVLTTEEFSAQIATDGAGSKNGFWPFIIGITIALAGGTGFLIFRKKLSE